MSTATATKTQIGTCGWAGHVFTRPATAGKISTCPTCAPVDNGDGWVQHSHIKWANITACVTTKTCDEACASAKGAKCSCECGGTNHGSAHGGY